MIVTAMPPHTFPWLTSRAESVASPDMRAIGAVDPRTWRIGGMIGFDGWTPNSVVMTIALDTPIAFRVLIRNAFDYVFNQSKRGVALATVRGTNTRSLKLCKHVGFREAYRVRDGVNVGEDLVVFEMRREECRWIEQRKAA